MDNSIVPSTWNHFLAPKEQRQYDKAVQQLGYSHGLGMAKLEQQTERQAAIVQGVGFVAQTGLQAVAVVSQMENGLTDTMPGSAGRFRHIGDMATIAIGGVVAETPFKLGR